MTREIPMAGGHVAFVDDEDYERVAAAGRWHARRNRHTVYAQRSVTRADGRHTTQQMHTLITGWPYVEHKNGNGLDNRRSNLRQANQSQNNGNQRGRSGTSPYKGVSLRRRSGRWCAQIKHGATSRHLGYFDSQEAAARAYDAAAVEQYGEFARLNFPTERAS